MRRRSSKKNVKLMTDEGEVEKGRGVEGKRRETDSLCGGGADR
jgi:hypothetical protein